MTLIDHVMILLLFAVQPVHGALAYRRFIARIAAGLPANRITLYRHTIVLEWCVLAILLVAWHAFDRPLAALGIVTPGGSGFLVGLLLLVAFVPWLVFAWRRARRADDADRATVLEALGDQQHLLPDSIESYRWFAGLSITAGIVEEIVYRGFVFWYLAHWLPVWAVIVASAVAFGLGHSYQGAAGIVKITLAGIAFGAFYVLTGSIWLPIVAHALVDLLQGAMIFEYLRRGRGSGERES